MNEDVLEKIYQEKLEEQIIAYLAEKCDFSYEKAMDIYYSSKLSNMIYMGKEGIQYLDYKVLVQILLETETALFARRQSEDGANKFAPSERVRGGFDLADNA